MLSLGQRIESKANAKRKRAVYPLSPLMRQSPAGAAGPPDARSTRPLGSADEGRQLFRAGTPAGLPTGDAIRRTNPVSWNHANLCGDYSFRWQRWGVTSRNWLISWRQPTVSDKAYQDAFQWESKKDLCGTLRTFVVLTRNACQHVHLISAFDFEQTESQIAWRFNLRRLRVVGFGEIFKNFKVYRS
jgi:hypothetical protein